MARRWQKQTPKTKTKTRIPRLNKIPFLMEEPTTAPTVGPNITATPSLAPTASPTTVSPTTLAPTKGPTVSPTTADPTKGPTVYPTTAVPIGRPMETLATTIPTAGPDKRRRNIDEDKEEGDEREEDVLVYDPSLRHQRRKWDMFKGVLNNFNSIVEYEDGR